MIVFNKFMGKTAFFIVCLMFSLFSFLTCTSGRFEKKEELEAEPVPAALDLGCTVYAGTNEGLFLIHPNGATEALWTGGQVKKILFTPSSEDPRLVSEWAVLTGGGILVSADLRNWAARNRGLPEKTIKIYDNGAKSFVTEVQEIKDLEINPLDPRIMVCATKDRVYLSRDRGITWTSLGAPQYNTNGIKAVAAAFLPELTVFMSHSIYGIHYILPNSTAPRWTELITGLEKLESTNNADEVSDIAVYYNPGSVQSVFVSQTFRRRIYRLDWGRKRFDLVWKDNSAFGTVDSLSQGETGLNFLYEGTAASIDFPVYTMREQPDILNLIRKLPAGTKPNCIVTEDQHLRRTLYSELWLLDEPAAAGGIAANKEGLYLPVNHAMDAGSLRPYLETMQRAGLNMIVIDMKDDYGRLRFTPLNQNVSARGRVFRPIDIDAFLQDMKNRGIYTVARVVVFKDPVLAARENNRLAVWDSRNSRPWVGYEDARRRKTSITDAERRNELMQFFPADDPDFEIVRTFYDERWVDPYSEEVWDYIAALSVELHERGFDEIQYDYIRFPTDGVNLSNARFRWQDSGMDRESAIHSFMRHIRARVSAPISIDIYGANGWYRTGSRTGQEVELLAPYVDVICPMYYPSHFEQYFMAQNPPELRPWRIYYHGTLRTSRISRGQVIVRPYAQAFFINVSYDRAYYNTDYVRRQIEGVREAGNGGFTYWNNSGRYADIPSREN